MTVVRKGSLSGNRKLLNRRGQELQKTLVSKVLFVEADFVATDACEGCMSPWSTTTVFCFEVLSGLFESEGNRGISAIVLVYASGSHSRAPLAPRLLLFTVLFLHSQ
jgi:hypothetical protein